MRQNPVLVASVLPSDQLVKTYSPCGVAVTVTVCPFSYSPPVVLTLPPSPAEKVIVYLAIGVGGGVTGVEVSSEEQDSINIKMLRTNSSFFINRDSENKNKVFKRKNK